MRCALYEWPQDAIELAAVGVLLIEMARCAALYFR